MRNDIGARATTVTSQIRNCFITAPAGSNLDVLSDALRQRAIHVVVPEQLPLDLDLETEITEVIRNVDLVIGVLTRERRSEWTLFELGQAWALGKRVLLFAPPNTSHLPSTLRRFLTVRANLSNREAIEFALDQLLAAPEPTQGRARPRSEKAPLGASADRYLQGSLPMIADVNPFALERLVADGLKESGVDVLSTSQDRNGGADLAIWSDALQTFVGNPLLVEIKSKISGYRQGTDAALQLARHVAAAGGVWGLLLYGSGPPELKSLPPNILALTIEALFSRLKTESFDDIVRDLRNRRVHGVGL
jgi:hypothetical protein